MTLEKPTFHWPKGRRAAVSMCYDDGLTNHIQLVAPALEKRRLKATFYAPLRSNLMEDPLAWRALAGRGHELGNHTVYHPCWGVMDRYKDWLKDDQNLVHYDEERWLDEIHTANQALAMIDGKQERTFGNTCYDIYMGPEFAPVPLEPLIAQVFEAARGEATRRPVDLANINYYNLGTTPCEERSFGDFAPELDQILDTGGWMVYTFHGVRRGSHNLYIDEKEHNRLLDFLREKDRDIWTSPVKDVVQFLKKSLPG